MIRTLIATPILFVLIFATSVLGRTGNVRADPLDATELYPRAVVAMNDLKVPAFITYRLQAIGTGAGVRIQTEPCTYFNINSEERSIQDILSTERASLMSLSSRGRRAEAPDCGHGDVLSGCADKVITAIEAVLAVH